MRRSKTIEKSQAERFVDEYLVDFDPFLAAVRVGAPRLQAKKLGAALLGETEVQRALIARVDAMRPEEIATPQRILLGLMREAGRAAFSGDRTSALKQVHEMLKDLREQARDDADAARSEKRGGVMLAPGTPSLTDWEAAAAKMQKELKEKVKE